MNRPHVPSAGLSPLMPSRPALLRVVWALAVAAGTEMGSAAPVPANHEVVPAAPGTLRWDAAPGTIRYDVFFGTDRQQIVDAERSVPESPVYLGSGPTPEIAASVDFSPGGVWYWRVDTVTEDRTTKGPVWQFSGQLALSSTLQGPESYYDIDDHQITLGTETCFAGYPEWVSSSNDNRPGQVQVFRRSSGADTWHLAQSLNKPSGSAANARFGSAVLLRDTIGWIGASGDGPGSVFQYRLDEATDQWKQTSLRLRSTLARTGERFGFALAQGNEWLAVGVPSASSSGRQEAGAVDIFDSTTGEWKTRLLSRRPNDYAYFGRRIDGDGETLAIMDPGSEAIEMYRRATDGTWFHDGTIAPPGFNPLSFGASSMAFSGGVLLVGVPAKDELGPGRVYVFERDPDSSWRRTWQFEPYGSRSSYTRVAIQGSRAAIHLPGDAGTESMVALWQRESDASWIPLGTTTQTAPDDKATGGAVAIALSDRALLQTGTIQFRPRLRFYLHNVDANVPPAFVSSPVGYGEEGRPYAYPIEVGDENAGDVVTVAVGPLPPWLRLTAGSPDHGMLQGTPPIGVTGEFPIELRATDSRGATISQTFVLQILASGGLPVIASVSPDQTIHDHQRLTLTVTLEDDGPATFQWFVNDIPLPGQIAASLVIDPVQASDAGLYTVKVTRAPADVVSPAVIVTVEQVPDRFGGDWPTFGASTSHSGRYPATLGNHTFLPAWTKVLATDGSVANQVATGAGTVFATITNRTLSPPVVRAVDLKSGADLWSRSVPLSNAFSAPTYHRGVVYTQRAKDGPNQPDVRAFEAVTGTPRWTRPYPDQTRIPYAPAVTDDGLYFMSGEHGGLSHLTLDGVSRWIVSAAARDQWTPLVHQGRLFYWLGGIFSELRPDDGLTIWSLTTPWTSWEWYSVMTVPAAEGDLVAVLDSDALRVIDLATRSVRWTQSGLFPESSPAIGDGIVYAITPGAIQSYRASDGTVLNRFLTEDATGASRIGVHQPLVLDDHVVVSSDSETWVFDRGTQAVKQRLPAGGPLTYADGMLVAAGGDGVLRAFALNQPPVIAPPSETFVWTEDTARTWTLAVTDPDGDILTVRVDGRPGWMSVSDPVDGELTFSGIPALSSHAGDFPLTVTVSDGKSSEATRIVNVTVIAVNDPPTSVVPPDLVVDEDSTIPAIRIWEIFDDEEDGSAGLVYSVDEPPAGVFSAWMLDPAAGVLNVTLMPDFSGTGILRFRARDTGGLEAERGLNVSIQPVPDAPRVPATLPSPDVPVDGSPVSLSIAEFFTDVDPGDVLRYSIAAIDQPMLFSTAALDAATGDLRLVWASYVWGSATLTLRGTDRDGLLADTTVTVTLPPPPAPVATLQGTTRLNRQTGLVEQIVSIKNTGPRALGGFNLWVDGGSGAILYNGASGETISPTPPAPWFVPYHVPLAAGADVSLVLEFYSAQRKAVPTLQGASPINGVPPESGAGPPGTSFAVSRMLAVVDGLLVEFPSVPGAVYQVEYSADNTSWTTSPIALRAGGTAVQWIDRGPPATPTTPQHQPVRFYRVRKL